MPFSVSRIKQETGVAIKIPSDGDNSNIIRIEGEPQGVKVAKEQLLEMAKRMVSSLICACALIYSMGFMIK